MKTILINVDSEKPEDGELEEAVRIILNNCVVYSGETMNKHCIQAQERKYLLWL